MFHQFTSALIAFGPWGIFLLSLIDSIGVPLPAAMDILVIGIAAGSAKSPGHAYFAAFMAVLGSASGNIALFEAARHGMRRFVNEEAPPGKRQRFQKWFNRYGLLTVFVPAITPFVPLPLKVFVVSAGALRTSLPKFILLIVVARSIRYFGEAYLGVQLGADAQSFLMRNGWTLAGIALATAFALYWLVRLADRHRESEI